MLFRFFFMGVRVLFRDLFVGLRSMMGVELGLADTAVGVGIDGLEAHVGFFSVLSAITHVAALLVVTVTAHLLHVHAVTCTELVRTELPVTVTVEIGK